MKGTITILALLFCSLFILPEEAFSQAHEDEEFHRVSLSLQAGLTMSYEKDINRLIGSNYNTFTQQTYNFGGGIQYAITPFWTAELGYRYNTIEALADDGFETVVHSPVFKNIFNLNRIYSRSSLSHLLNPYLILGYEHDFYTAEDEDSRTVGNESALLGGFGLALSLSNTFDVFAQYEAKLASNRMDNINTGFPADQVGMTSAGIRINFGRSSTKPLKHAPPIRNITESEYDMLMSRIKEASIAGERLTMQEEKIDDLQNQLSELDAKLDEHIRQSERFNELLIERIDSLEYRVNNMEISIDSLESERVKVLRSEVPAGHYVQVFASLDYNSANNVREIFIELLGDEFDYTDEMVFVIKRQQFYEVLIGTYHRISDAQDVHNIAVDRLPDSFVITFPRPLHLEEAYKGTEIIRN